MLRLFHKDHRSGFRNFGECRFYGGKSREAEPCFLLWRIIYSIRTMGGWVLLPFALCGLALLSGCTPIESAFDGVERGVISAMIGTPEEVTSVSEDRLAYRQLGEEEKPLYDQMLDCILKHEEEVPLSTIDAKECDRAFSAMMADYGGLFWVNGYSYRTYGKGDETIGFVFEPTYTMDRDERDDTQRRIDNVVEDWLAQLPEGADDYTKSKFVFETLIDRVDYDKESDNNQNIISVFLGGATVCQGYADATNYLLQQLAIPSMVVTGEARGIAHAWNLVILDGDYYYLDTTWGNSMYLNTDEETVKHINYAYLNITSEELRKTHTIDSKFSMPECVAIADNYFTREGKFFTDWYEEDIGIALSNGYYNQEKTVSVKFADLELYNRAKRFYIDDGHLTEYCEGLDSITYMESTDTCVLTVEYP